MLNSVNISGRIAQDPEFKVTQSGVEVVSFNIAVQRNYKNKQGEYDADFFRVSAFKGTANIINTYLKKGDRVNISGKLHQRSFENEEGKRVSFVEIIVNDIDMVNTGQQQGQQQQTQGNWNKGQGQAQKGQNNWQQKQQNNQQNNNPFNNAEIDIDTDDLPFDFGERKEVMN